MLLYSRIDSTGNNTPSYLARIARHGIRVYIYIHSLKARAYKAIYEGLKPFVIEYYKQYIIGISGLFAICK